VSTRQKVIPATRACRRSPHHSVVSISYSQGCRSCGQAKAWARRVEWPGLRMLVSVSGAACSSVPGLVATQAWQPPTELLDGATKSDPSSARIDAGRGDVTVQGALAEKVAHRLGRVGSAGVRVRACTRTP
jgi:hypothetical protein